VSSWIAAYGDADNQYLSGLATLSNGDVIVGGYFFGQIDLGGGAFVQTPDPNMLINGADAFVARLSGSGTHVWSKSYGGGEGDGLFGLATDTNDMLLMAGSFNVGIDFGGGTVNAVDADGFLAKVDAAGSSVWTIVLGGAADQRGWELALDTVGNSLLLGGIYGDTTIGGNTITHRGARDLVVAKLAP
jgi:hypothetical protein